MTTLQAAPWVAPDESAVGFISTFMSHVATLTDYDQHRLTTTAGIKTLLLAAMDHGEGDATNEWRALYRAVDHLIDASRYAHDTRTAYAYFSAFILENRDLADDEPPARSARRQIAHRRAHIDPLDRFSRHAR